MYINPVAQTKEQSCYTSNGEVMGFPGIALIELIKYVLGIQHKPL